ncbi:hypothetical protein ACEWY4_000283 [Coilia grayii]|uniref:DDE Tnp4 domain-containing protein n=1 Tax=Coilia grayii TaxID=363190 RepID=A0ABD1KW76_9TELE
MADLALLEDLNARIRQERMFRDRRDFFRENDVWLISRFRLPRHLLMELCDTLEPQLQRETRRSNAIPVSIQIICDAQMAILNMVARWPGGTHDSFIFQNSMVGTRLQGGALRGKGHLMGDKGYPLTEYLITPLAQPQTEQERRFNRSHIRTRAIVERCIGVLKGRWLCLGAAGGVHTRKGVQYYYCMWGSSQHRPEEWGTL